MLSSEVYGPFSCRSQEEIQGIIRFPVLGATNKNLSLVLKESGRAAREIKIEKVAYKF